MRRFRLRSAIGTLLVVSFVGTVQAQADEADESDPATAKEKEIEVEFPPYPNADSLLAFDAGAASGNRFMIDQTSISIGQDGVIRYVLVIRSPSGVDNVRFEGMRCETLERRLYATGRDDRTWSRSRNDKWVKITSSTLSLPHMALARLYLCDNRIPIRSAREGIEAIHRGGPRPILLDN
ncbi:MAG: CNP1-like family protein [Candidatus Methylophosphatis roskildensis]